MTTPKGDTITVFDLRFCIPNKEILPEKGIHTLEHLFAGFMRDHLNGQRRRNHRHFPDGLPYRFLHEPHRYAPTSKSSRRMAPLQCRMF